MRQRLHAANIKCYMPDVNEVLSTYNKDDRIGFAFQYSVEHEAFWNKAIFTDKKCFSSMKTGSQEVCWRVTNTRYSQKYIVGKARSGRVIASLWGWMWAYGPDELIEIEGQWTGEKYIRIHEELLLPTMHEMAIPALILSTLCMIASPSVWAGL